MDAPSGQTPISGRTPTSGEAGGFRSQPLWLKVLLVLSVLALATGIVRCSFEATAPQPARTEAS